MANFKSENHYNIGFLGAGRMCQALSKGFSSAGLATMQNMICSGTKEEKLEQLSKETGIKWTTNVNEVVKSSQLIIIAVKPHIVPEVLTKVAKGFQNPVKVEDKLFISVVVGLHVAELEKYLPKGARVIRVMPNTPALVQCAASVYCPGTCSTKDDEEIVRKLFSSIGYCESLPEGNLDAATGVSGSGPAYIFMAIEALADGGVKMGLPRDVAQRLAAQTLMGAAKMVLETDQHPGQLKDAVCSPGGTTIAAVHHLETNGFRGALMGAVEASAKKAAEVGNKKADHIL